MSRLPVARAHVRGTAGHVEHAAVVARHTARRAGRGALIVGKVTLWLTVVCASLATIGYLAAPHRPRYSADLERIERLQQHMHAQARAFDAAMRAIEIVDAQRAVVATSAPAARISGDR